MKTESLLKKIGLWVTVGIVTAILAACSDDDMGVTAKGGEEICFRVAESSSWTRVASRSGARAGSSSLLPLVSGSDSLFLSAVESEAWSEDCKVDSRSAVVSSSDDLESIGVFATRSTLSSQPPYMNNVEVTRISNWTPKAEYLWPGDGSLHFNAYSPYVAAGTDEGIVSVPHFDANDSLSLEFVTPAEVADQIDLMIAVATDASASPCKLEFNHALTGIRFVTGSQMTPCTVTKIEIVGVASRGILNLDNGRWSEVSGSASYSVASGVPLDAAPSSKYVAPDIALTSDDQIFLLMPQQLPDDAKIILTVEVGGNTSSFEASLAGQSWSAGRTVTYRLSATAESSSLILSVVDNDGNPLTKLNAKYTGSTLNYYVNSYYSADGSTKEPVEWDASLLDSEGNILSASPDWLVSYTTEGSDATQCSMVTDMTTPVFLQMSDETRALQNASDINASSGQTPYNLSNSSGASAVENTANSYLINAPGKYSLPLVYGNAVKDGAANTASYISTLTSNRTTQKTALLTFINHLGNAITDPYIYNNAGCEPYDAVLVWEEKIGLVRNVSLSADKKNLEFEIPAGFIRQGNADVAVRDKNGTVMWSWQLWVTDFVNGSDWYTVPVEGVDYHLYPHTMGRVYAGDRTQFSADSVVMRLTQKNVPDGMEPLSVDIPVQLAGKVIDTKSYYSFYQWGRKDPMVSGVDQFYNGSHNEISAEQLPETPFGSDHKAAIMQAIMHPELFQTASTSDLSVTPFYVNLWDIDDISMKPNAVNKSNVKTVYDPCPVGAKVPVGNEFISLMKYEFTYDAEKNSVYFTLPSGRQADFALLGYRSKSGSEETDGALGGFWTAVAAHRTTELAQYFHVGANSSDLKFATTMPLYGFGLRPVKDE